MVDLERARKRYEVDGWVLREIAEEQACDWQVLRRCLVKAGVKMRNRGLPRADPERNRQILQLRQEGVILRQIARRFGISLSRVGAIIQHHQDSA